MNAVVVFCNALTLCSFVLGRSRPKILAISLYRNQACTLMKHKGNGNPKIASCSSSAQHWTFQSPIFGFEVFFRETSTRLAVGPNFLRYEFVEAPEMPYWGT